MTGLHDLVGAGVAVGKAVAEADVVHSGAMPVTEHATSESAMGL